MFLKRLDIQGFKSFPQRIRVDFGPGITSVVGPNGSGKTNIVEAIRWVLGEQNMRHLRGDTLEDVIFTGSARRKPLGMAEVALTLVNNRGVLPVEYTELQISRRTFRNGQSEYFINKQACRLRDLRDLFLDTGMGSHAYSLIERGMVDNVLSDESGHRRFLFEEAAGIMRYKTRKKEALQKLDLTVTDLTRVSDIIAEIEREVRSLARQVGKARRYGRLRDEARRIDLGLAREAYDRLAGDETALKAEREAAENRRAALSGALALEEAAVEASKVELLKREGELRLAHEALSAHEARGAALLNEVAVLNERRSGLAEKLEHAGSEAARLKASVGDIRTALARLSAECADLERAQNGKERELQALEVALEELKPRLAERQAAVLAQRQLSLDLFQARVARESTARAWDARREDLAQRRQELLERRDALEREREALKAAAEETDRALEAGAADAARVRAAVEEATRAIADAEERHRLHDEVEKRARESFAALSARHATLKELKERYEGYDPSVRSLVAGPARPERILGTVGDVLHASGDWLVALEAALGEAVQFIVAERTDAALKALAALEASGEGRATFIALDRLSRARAAAVPEEVLGAPGVRGLLLEHVRFEPGYVGLASFLLSSVVVVDSLVTGLELLERFSQHRLHFVTRKGERVVAPGILQGGAGATRAGSVLRREEELRELGEELLRSSAALEDATAERLRGERVSAVAALEERNRALHAAEEARRGFEARRAEGAFRAAALEEAAAAVASALESVEADEARAVAEGETAALALQSAEQERGQLDEALAREEAALRELTEERDRRAARDAALRIDAARSRGALDAAERELARLRATAEEAEGTIRAREAEAADTTRRIEETQSERARKEEELTHELALKAVREGALEAAREAFGAAKGATDDADARARDLRREHSELTERLHRTELEHAESDAEMRLLCERIRNEYEVDLAAYAPPAETAEEPRSPLAEIEEAEVEAEPGSTPDEALVDRAAAGSEPLPDGVGREAREVRLKFLQDRLRSFGPVNLLAVQDYEERRERLRFLTGQRNDLEEARASLLTAIQKINGTASELFLQTFERVDLNFKQVFSTLFEGGEAALALTGEDPLEAEIEILARPRGKKPQALSLLSGGEKALTAIALLFAIYLVKPSPFCILDEVDAPLDDANIDRFVLLLKEFSANTQFIVVTHNKKTMEVADCLYGVTMEEPGVSKLVSVRWSDELPEGPPPAAAPEPELARAEP